MTSTEPIQSKRSVYDTCDPHYLRQLREKAGMDLVVLARTACLSVAQVRQLESENSEGLFYSDAIKRQAYKRLLMILGAEPPTVEVPEDLRDASKVADAHLNTLDQIVAMSHQPAMNRSTSDVLASGFSKLKEHRQAWSASLLLLGAVGLFLAYGPQPWIDAAPVQTAASEDRSSAKTVSPISESMSVASAPASAAVVQLPAPVVEPVASVTMAPTPTPTPAPAPAPAVQTPAAASSQTACAYSSDAMPELTPFVAQKEGKYVYLVSSVNTEICVVDGHKQATAVQLKAGENRSIYGVAPWQVSALQLPKVQLYFQGGRVTIPERATRVKLIEAPVQR